MSEVNDFELQDLEDIWDDIKNNSQLINKKMLKLLFEMSEYSKNIYRTTLAYGGLIDNADTTDRTIEPEDGFSSITIINDGSETLYFAIDEDSTNTESNRIIIKTAEKFNSNLRGDVLHYSVGSDTGEFRILLGV